MLRDIMKRNISAGLCIAVCLFIINIPVNTWGSVSLNADGTVSISGSHSFECQGGDPPLPTSATAYMTFWEVPNCNGICSVNIETVTSDSPTVSIDTEYNLACRYEGPYVFGISYGGGRWMDLPDGSRTCISDSYAEPEVTIDLPKGREITIFSNDRVSGVETIGIDYNFTYSSALPDGNRYVGVLIDNESVYSEGYLPESGSIPITYDFSDKKGFVLIRASASCLGHGRTVEKLVYVEPEDSCPVKVGKPVSVASGNVYASETDFTLKGVMPLTFTRYYDSAETSRDFGQAWTHSYDTRVSKFANSAGNIYTVINPDGSQIHYIDNDGDGIYDAEFPRGEKSRLIKDTYNNIFIREFFDGAKEKFNGYGRLTEVVDRNGNKITITRGTNYRITKITDPVGREINFTYNTSNKIISITIPDGRIYSYAYKPTSGYLGKVTYPDESYRIYEYVNKSGYKLSGIKDEKGNYIEKHDYDAQGRATTSSSDGTNEKLTINYLSDTQSTVTDSFGRLTTFTIDKTLGQSHATNISGPGCKSCGQGDTSRTYDNNLNVTSITDANGNVTTMTYDDKGNMLTRTEAYGTTVQRTTTYTYNSFGQVLTGTDNDGIITSYTYDTNGNILSKTEAYGTADERTTTYTYNANGQMLTVTDPNGNTTTNTYDQYGNLASEINALNQTITYMYDVMGNPLSMTDDNGNMITYEYDSRDRLKKETRPDTGVINYEYDPAGNRTAIIDANGNRTTYTFNAINQLITTTDPEGNSTNYTYDTEVNMTSMTIKDSVNNVMTSETYTYDDHNRLTRTTHADGTYTEQSYDAVGNVLTKRDENGNATTNAYDALNRLQSVTDQNGGITSYTYDSRDDLRSISDANGNVTTYTYDRLNRLKSTTSPDTGTTTYTYDDNGNMLTKTDANVVMTTYTHDALNRKTAMQFPDTTQNINYFYDDPQAQNGKGRLTVMTDPSGYTWYDYDSMGRVAKETKKINNILYRTEYTYDLNGNVSTITYPGGREITFTYSQLNKVTTVTDTYLGVMRMLAINITYLPFGDMGSITYGNNFQRTIGHDNRYRIDSMTTGTVQSLSYNYFDNGNISDIADNLDALKNKTFTYDPLNRLTIGVGLWGAITYAYDDVGNRTYETTDTGNTTYTYNTNTNKLTAASGEKNLAFSYDSDGNTTTENSRQYIYDQNQRLIKAMEGSNVLGEYIYNGKGQRAEKWIPSQNKCTIFHYDQNGLLITETTSAGNIKAEYVNLNGQPLAKIEGNNIYYYHNDHLGTPLLMTDSSGSVVWQGEFKPFGEPLSVSGSITNNLRFPGQYYDSETGLHQNWFRDYKAEIGRYVEADPIGIQQGTNHLYVYSLSNPLFFYDPDGKAVSKCCGMTSELPQSSVMIGLECMSKCLKCPLYISSGWRSQSQNRQTPGAANESYHLSGLAADVHEPPSKSKLRKAANECGFYDLPKAYSNRIHVDLRNGRSPKSEPDECKCKKIREGN